MMNKFFVAIKVAGYGVETAIVHGAADARAAWEKMKIYFPGSMQLYIEPIDPTDGLSDTAWDFIRTARKTAALRSSN